MLIAVDHIVVSVADLTAAVETYRRLGFTVAHHEGKAAYAMFGDFYLQFKEGDNEGLERLVLRSDALEADVARLKSERVPVTDPVSDPLDGPGGSLVRHSVAVETTIPMGFVEHRHETGERLDFLGGASTHQNTTTTLERTYLAVESIDEELKAFEQVLGAPAPEAEMGTVIMSMMSVFYLGDIGIAVAEPRGPGPTADALNASGPGPFQVLFRAEHLDQAAQLMVDNGLPPPERGTRLSGESALLVEPANACGVYVAMAGMP